VPTRFDRDAVLEEVARDYAGPIAVGEDLMRFDCVARRLAYGDFHLQLGRPP
jgi:ribonuclease Z